MNRHESGGAIESKVIKPYFREEIDGSRQDIQTQRMYTGYKGGTARQQIDDLDKN